MLSLFCAGKEGEGKMSENRTLHNLHTIDIKVGEYGLTVRRSDKWHSVKEGDILDLCECLGGCKVVGDGVVSNFIWIGKFQDIPAKLLETEHDCNSRNYTGLLMAMRRGYADFQEDDVVVAFSYKRTK
jgi:hypothetical protein